MPNMEEELRSKIDLACRTAEDFTKLYYESLDKNRHVMHKLYMETALLTWNGNGVEGNQEINKFCNELPPSNHTVITLDSQPVTGPAVGAQITFLVKVSGNVKYKDKAAVPFSQNFLVTALNDKWKIVSDCFRTQEPLNS